jgi:aryl-alcohol dehydrogenase-like predicted oxidoreductase
LFRIGASDFGFLLLRGQKELMILKRRDFLKAGISAAAAAWLPSLRVLAQSLSPLLQRKIPSTGENIPIIGIGTARRYEEIKTDAEKLPLKETIRQFSELGGKVIDTSPSYGTAEAVVGELVESLKVRDSLFLATKVSLRNVGREAGLQQIEQSFKKLRGNKIDLVAVHNLRDTQTQLRTLRELKEAGRIRYVGITTSFDNQYGEFEQTMKQEPLDFIQVDYALDNRDAGERIIPLAGDRGIAVMINLPFGRGRLFNAVQGKKLPDWASEFDCTSWAQFFLKYIVSHPAVTCAVPGMARAEYVIDNLGAARGRLPDAVMRRRMEKFIDGV